jgi:hypothetical protein
VVCGCHLQDAAIAKSEVELKRRTDEIERKTRETDNLNRKLERLLAAQPGQCRSCMHSDNVCARLSFAPQLRTQRQRSMPLVLAGFLVNARHPPQAALLLTLSLSL